MKNLQRTNPLLFAVSLLGIFICAGPFSLYAKGQEDVSPSQNNSHPEVRVVKDSEGQEVEIPWEVTKAGPVIGAFAQITQVVSAGSGKISAAATQNINSYFKKVFPDYIQSNSGNFNATSVEELIASETQVAYGPGTIFSAEQKEQLRKAGVAFVPINNVADVAGLCQSFQIVGDILGEDAAKRAAEFVTYYQGNIKAARDKTAGITDTEKVRFLSIFYSANAYATTNGRDISNEYIEAAGGINTAKNYLGGAAGNSLTVDAEQIVQWDPQVIMTSNQTGAAAVLKDPALQTVSAVKNGRVYVCPYGIYLWSVRSGEGAMLPLWMGTKMYPDRFTDINMGEVVKYFFNHFYNYDIPAAEIDTVLAGDASTAMTR
ncbi:periplasmic binding protein [Treponema primitia ZAS-2]|uniref:Periplasmic binding protein n=1 Tax=Treponema primitia (strain ATCC BAA-887 / DSM 12427 / ZAS-2) TaxID=545694 RepID=F5YR05_TREPZ|nr:ABC transporter substrate-binding protein [Treponema primitia]AEF84717.1 periplasmic binding protein [Treponema primitia ZAS-2]